MEPIQPTKRGRKKKVQPVSEPVPPAKTISFNELNPVVLELTIPTEEDHSQDDTPLLTYSDLLNEVQPAYQSIPIDVLKEILQKCRYDSYPEGTHCMWDCHPFEGVGIPILTYYDAIHNEYQGFGHFCSPSCALAYLNDMKLNSNEYFTSYSLMQSVFAKDSNSIIPPAPSKASLKIFGGALVIQQFRQFSMTHPDYAISVNMPPIKLHIPNLDIQISTMATGVETANELYLKRSKPIQQKTSILNAF